MGVEGDSRKGPRPQWVFVITRFYETSSLSTFLNKAENSYSTSRHWTDLLTYGKDPLGWGDVPTKKGRRIATTPKRGSTRRQRNHPRAGRCFPASAAGREGNVPTPRNCWTSPLVMPNPLCQKVHQTEGKHSPVWWIGRSLTWIKTQSSHNWFSSARC